jgi:hypothetical protein
MYGTYSIDKNDIILRRMLCYLQNPAGEVKEYDYEYYDDTKPASPFVNPHDPTHRQVR